MTAIPRQWSHNNITVCHLFRQSSQKSKPLFKTSTENPAQPVCPSKYGVNLTLPAATMLTILAMENRQNPVPVQKLCPNSEVIPMALYLGKIIFLLNQLCICPHKKSLIKNRPILSQFRPKSF